MNGTGSSFAEEVIGKDIDAIRREMEKRVEYVRNVQNVKNAGNTEYKKLGEYTLIRMFYPLPADFCEIFGEQFALGSENDAYEFRLSEAYRTDFEWYMNTLRSRCEQDGITFIPVIWSETQKKRYSFPCKLRGIVSMNVAKKAFKLYAECMKAVRAETAEGLSFADAGEAEKNADRLFLCEAEHEERKDLIQRPLIEGEKGALDEMDSLMKMQTFAITPFLSVAFFAAAVFSWQLQTTGDSGIGQTVFLAAMGIGFLVFAVYNTVIRVRKIKRHNEKVRGINEKNRSDYEAAMELEEKRYREEREKLV